MSFLKVRKEEHITWAGLAGVTSIDQRREQIKAAEMQEGNRWTGPGQAEMKGKMKAVSLSITER